MSPMRHNDLHRVKWVKIVANQHVTVVPPHISGRSFRLSSPLYAAQRINGAARRVLTNRPLGRLLGFHKFARIAHTSDDATRCRRRA